MKDRSLNLTQVRVESWIYWVRHSLQKALVLIIGVVFFLCAMTIVYLAVFFSDDLTHTVGDCVGYKDGWVHQPCSRSVQNLLLRVRTGEPKNFFNL